MSERSDGRRALLRALPWVVVGVVMVTLAGVAVFRLFLDAPANAPEEATTVQDVADLSTGVVEAADVDGGVDLLCDQPIPLYRMAVEATLGRWQREAGGQVPTLQARVRDVDGGGTGSFVLSISSSDPAVTDADRTWRVFVDSRDGRSCVTGLGGPKAERPRTVFSREGYNGSTVPPTPRGTSTTTSAG